MPWSGSAGSETFSRTDGISSGSNTWQTAAAAPRNIEADDHDTHDQDVADGVNACLKKDGGNTATADIPFGGFSAKNLAGVKDTNGNELVQFQTTASAVNQVDVTNAAMGGKPTIAATGDDANIILRISGKGTGGAEIEGTATNDSGAAGYVGEYISASVAVGSAVSLTTATPANITSISLTAGDWDVTGVIYFNTTSTTSITIFGACLTATSATFSLSAGAFVRTVQPAEVPLTGSPSFTSQVGPYRISLASTTTIYLVSTQEFTASTLTGWGLLSARRVR